MKRRWIQKPGVMLACAFLALLTLAAVAGPVLFSMNPYAVHLDQSAAPPGQGHWFGADFLGRDILARVLIGARISLAVGLLSTLLALGIGTVMGMAAGYWGGKIDRCFQIVTDILQAFPSLLLAIAVAVVFQGGIVAVCAALAVVGWASFARVIRGGVLSMKEKPFVSAARASGCRDTRILFRHVLPNVLTIVFALAGMRVGGFILGEASLSFLGLGVQPPTPSWGSMVQTGMVHLRACPWTVVFPGTVLTLTILSCNVIGDYLQEKCALQATAE